MAYAMERDVCRAFDKDLIYAEITVGQFARKPVWLPRIPLLPAFKFRRIQFPNCLCFAMTIHKANNPLCWSLFISKYFLTWATIYSIVSWDFYGNFKSLAQNMS